MDQGMLLEKMHFYTLEYEIFDKKLFKMYKTKNPIFVAKTYSILYGLNPDDFNYYLKKSTLNIRTKLEDYSNKFVRKYLNL